MVREVDLCDGEGLDECPVGLAAGRRCRGCRRRSPPWTRGGERICPSRREVQGSHPRRKGHTWSAPHALVCIAHQSRAHSYTPDCHFAIHRSNSRSVPGRCSLVAGFSWKLLVSLAGRYRAFTTGARATTHAVFPMVFIIPFGIVIAHWHSYSPMRISRLASCAGFLSSPRITEAPSLCPCVLHFFRFILYKRRGGGERQLACLIS